MFADKISRKEVNMLFVIGPTFDSDSGHYVLTADHILLDKRNAGVTDDFYYISN